MKVRLSRLRVVLITASACLVAFGQSPDNGTPQKSTRQGLQLLHKMQSALGGAKRIAAIQDYEEITQADVFNNSGKPMGQVRKRTRWMRKPNLLRIDQIGPGATYVLFFDGDAGSGWEILPDVKNTDKFKTTGQVIDLVGGELQFAKNYISGFDLRLWLADSIPGCVVTSPRKDVVRIAHDGTAGDTTLNPRTWLPVKSAGVSLADPDRPVPQEMRFESWVTVGGVRFPAKRANYHSGVKLAEETDQEPIRINAGLTRQQLVAKPANFAPDLPSR